jgi:hypothetical protein
VTAEAAGRQRVLVRRQPADPEKQHVPAAIVRAGAIVPVRVIVPALADRSFQALAVVAPVLAEAAAVAILRAATGPAKINRERVDQVAGVPLPVTSATSLGFRAPCSLIGPARERGRRDQHPSRASIDRDPATKIVLSAQTDRVFRAAKFPTDPEDGPAAPSALIDRAFRRASARVVPTDPGGPKGRIVPTKGTDPVVPSDLTDPVFPKGSSRAAQSDRIALIDRAKARDPIVPARANAPGVPENDPTGRIARGTVAPTTPIALGTTARTMATTT